MRPVGKAIVLFLCMAGASSSFAADQNSGAVKTEAFKANIAAFKAHETFATLGFMLDSLRRRGAVPRAADEARVNRLLRFDSSHQYVKVDAVAAHDPKILMSFLRAMGMHHMSSYGSTVSGYLPITALESTAASGAVRFLRPATGTTRVGLVTSQGDRSMRTDEVRNTTGVDGRGVRVGVLSDSFECLQGSLFEGNPFTTVTEDIANDDLSPDVRVLSDITSNCFDEGRALLQLVHDVAPGAAGTFHTAANGQADFATGILELAHQAGSDVIVDDYIYFAEPMFADGIIAQAVDTVKRWGVLYFSSAGNEGRKSYESDFRPSGDFGVAGERHDFDPGEGVDPLQSVTISPGEFPLISFQWDEPYFSVSGEPGSASDLDILFYFDDGSPVPLCDPDTLLPLVCQFPGIEANVGGDPVEVVEISNGSEEPIQVNLSIELRSGAAPHLIKYVVFFGRGSFNPNEFDTESPPLFGHPNAAGAEAVGAATFSQTEEFPQPDPQGLVGVECIPACLNDFSSAGGVPILFNREGHRLTKPKVRLKPGITGPDGVNTTFFFIDDPKRDLDDFPNFFGTSASAAHVAAATALSISARGEGIARHGKFRMCKPRHHKSIEVKPSKALKLLNKGARFRGCEALQPDDYLNALHATAHDMFLRAFPADVFPPELGGGTAVHVPNPKGFDFDTGFGFIDAVNFFEVVAQRYVPH
jgi:hypothetical protein